MTARLIEHPVKLTFGEAGRSSNKTRELDPEKLSRRGRQRGPTVFRMIGRLSRAPIVVRCSCLSPRFGLRLRLKLAAIMSRQHAVMRLTQLQYALSVAGSCQIGDVKQRNTAMSMKPTAIAIGLSGVLLIAPATGWARTSMHGGLTATPRISTHVSLSKTPHFSRTTPDVVAVGRLSTTGLSGAGNHAEHWHSYGSRTPHDLVIK